jgi:hypothetical protein
MSFRTIRQASVFAMIGTAKVLRRTFCFLSQQTLLNYLQNSFFFVSRQQPNITCFQDRRLPIDKHLLLTLGFAP